MRRAHWLRGNVGSASAHSLIWVDTETDPILLEDRDTKHVLRFGWTCHQRTWDKDKWTEPEWLRFTTAAEFWSFVEDRTRSHVKTYVFAHNWAFDAPVLQTFDHLPQRGWVLKRAIVESPPVILSWRREQSALVMLDTLNWWRMPLARVGESLGCPKLEMPPLDAPSETWDTYCRTDVEVIRKAIHSWLAFLREHDLGDFAPTLAGQALRCFRHRFMDHPILVDDHPEALALARASLHGGRTEAFRIGKIKGPVHCLDVNSMYPAVMRDGFFPTILRFTARDVEGSELERWLESYCVVARVKLDCPEPRFAHWTGEKLIFPVGRFTTTLTTPDLITAQDAGWVKEIPEAAVYERRPIFSRFVDGLYHLRTVRTASGDKVGSWLLKILLNALYGKFAQHGGCWETTGEAPLHTIRTWREVDAETGRVYAWREFGGQRQILSREPESFDSHPAIAAHVTAYAREALWRLISRAGRRNVLYVDTDSLYVLEPGYKALSHSIHPTELGKLKLEASYRWLLIRGAKDYETPKGRVCKGVRLKAVWTGENSVTYDEWSTLTGLIRIGDLTGPRTRTRSKVLKREYDKGKVGRTGHVSPLTLRDW